jgi:hypothetical protein
MSMTPLESSRPMRAVAISSSMLMGTLYKIDPYNPNHSEIAEAIASAANQDPLFPHREDGCLRTACLLIAIAQIASSFSTNLIGDQGKRFGLYQIKPPKTDMNGKTITINMLNSARDSSLIAIDLIRTSMMKCKDRPWEERLAYFGGDEIDAVTLFKSMRAIGIADTILASTTPLLPSTASLEDSRDRGSRQLPR